MSDDESAGLIHPTEPPEFEFEVGQTFKISGVGDPEEYWYVKARIWNYDADDEDFGPTGWYFRQYEVGQVASLGGNARLVTEKTLLEQYETVSKEEAQEAVFGGENA